MPNFKIVEATEEKIASGISELENIVFELMKQQGKEGQFFTTGEKDISEYIKSSKNTVMVAVNNANEVLSATYITQGQTAFTYNDITKYFKYGEEYFNYIKNICGNSYKEKMLKTYKNKIEAFRYAKNKLLEESKFSTITEYLQSEKEKNSYDEKSILREKLNQYMSEYMQIIGEFQNYEMFYWVNAKQLAQEFGKNIDLENLKKTSILEYEELLEAGMLKIHGTNTSNISDYFNANTRNSIELDTYITNPNLRHSGLARILVYEGIKKHMSKNINIMNGDEIFLCSTLHKENLSSKYVSEFFGLNDSLYVQRREGRDREVHICKIKKEYFQEYLNNIQDKLIVLYGYNPENKLVTENKQIEILKEQIEYERNEYHRLNKVRHSTKNYTGYREAMMNKFQKKNRLRSILHCIKDGEEREND